MGGTATATGNDTAVRARGLREGAKVSTASASEATPKRAQQESRNLGGSEGALSRRAKYAPPQVTRVIDRHYWKARS